MKIQLKPMETSIRSDAEAFVNDLFNREAIAQVHTDQEYRAKREIAASVLNGGSAPQQFAEEAELMSLSVRELAQLVIGKPDTVLDRGIRRRRAILAVRAASRPSDIEAICASVQKKLVF